MVTLRERELGWLLSEREREGGGGEEDNSKGKGDVNPPLWRVTFILI